MPARPAGRRGAQSSQEVGSYNSSKRLHVAFRREKSKKPPSLTRVVGSRRTSGPAVQSLAMRACFSVAVVVSDSFYERICGRDRANDGAGGERTNAQVPNGARQPHQTPPLCRSLYGSWTLFHRLKQQYQTRGGYGRLGKYLYLPRGRLSLASGKAFLLQVSKRTHPSASRKASTSGALPPSATPIVRCWLGPNVVSPECRSAETCANISLGVSLRRRRTRSPSRCCEPANRGIISERKKGRRHDVQL